MISFWEIKTLSRILHVETVPSVAGYVGVPVVRVNLDEFLHGAGLHGDLSHQLLGRQVAAGVTNHSGSQHLGQVGDGHLGLFTLRYLQGGKCDWSQPWSSLTFCRWSMKKAKVSLLG